MISAIACNPTGVSEGLHGWHACRALAQLGELWLLVSDDQRRGIEEGRRRGLVPDNMHFVFIGRDKPYISNRLLARGQAWLRYMAFSRSILPTARRLHQEIHFDLSHQVTLSTWRVGSPLWRLGIPFIWGPISGTEVFPLGKLGRTLSPTAWGWEFARILGGVYSRLTPEVHLCARNAFHIFAAHQEAVDQLSKLRRRSAGISVLSYYAFGQATIAGFARPQFRERNGAPLKILAGGNLEGRKGVAIALHGLALARQQGANFSYRITGSGPEHRHVEALVRQLGLEKNVVVGRAFSREDYENELKDSDLYLLPSLREGGGLTMMEAMMAGCVPIVANCGGPGTAVSDECGVRVAVGSFGQMVEDVAVAIVRFDRNRALIPRMGAAAAARIAESYSDQSFLAAMEEVYDKALSSRVISAPNS